MSQKTGFCKTKFLGPAIYDGETINVYMCTAHDSMYATSGGAGIYCPTYKKRLERLAIQADQLTGRIYDLEDAANEDGDKSRVLRLQRLGNRAARRFWRRWNLVRKIDPQATLYH